MSSENKLTPKQVLETMLAKDYFTEWLGLEIEKIDNGYCKLHFTVRKEMLNGFGSIHGGILFSAADSAFAFACNSCGMITVALDVNISYTKPAFEGDKLTVEAREMHRGNKTGFYEVRTTNEKNELVAFFKGTAYQTSKAHTLRSEEG